MKVSIYGKSELPLLEYILSTCLRVLKTNEVRGLTKNGFFQFLSTLMRSVQTKRFERVEPKFAENPDQFRQDYFSLLQENFGQIFNVQFRVQLEDLVKNQ